MSRSLVESDMLFQLTFPLLSHSRGRTRAGGGRPATQTQRRTPRSAGPRLGVHGADGRAAPASSQIRDCLDGGLFHFETLLS